MKKENLYITGYKLFGENPFKKDLDEASGVEWTFVGLKSNHARKGALTEIKRYFLYFYFAIDILLHAKQTKNIITVQQFYGLNIAFFLRLFHLKNLFRLQFFLLSIKRKRGC